MKPGIRTTEFWISTTVAFVGFLATTGLFTPVQADALTAAIPQLGGLISMVAAAFGYSLSRGKAKGGEKK